MSASPLRHVSLLASTRPSARGSGWEALGGPQASPSIRARATKARPP